MLFLGSHTDAAGEEALPLTHKAYVVGIDPVAQSLTVRLFETDVSSDIRTRGELTLGSDEMTAVTFCNEARSFSDIKVGDAVIGTYHERMNRYFADTINLTGSAKC